MSAASDRETDVVLIGAGIMSATLGVFLKELEPSLSIQMCEILGDCAQESSDSWNNAGTGHAANCEMNYTPQRPDGSIDISKALQVNVEFDLSRQFWSYLIDRGSASVHPSGAAYELRARRGERRISPETVQGDVGPSLL